MRPPAGGLGGVGQRRAELRAARAARPSRAAASRRPGRWRIIGPSVSSLVSTAFSRGCARCHRAASCPPWRAHPPVPWARVALLAGPGRLASGGGGLVGEDRGQVARRRTGPPRRPAPAPGPPRPAPCRTASCTAPAILARTRLAPAAAASASHSPAPSPIARNCASAAVAGLRLALQRAGRRRRVVRVVDPRAARRGHQVAGHLGGAGRPDVGDHHLLAVPAHPAPPARPAGAAPSTGRLRT